MRIAVLVALVFALWASQDCPATAVRVGAVVVYVAGLAILVTSRAAAVAMAGFTLVGAGLFVLLEVVADLPAAGIVTGAALGALTALGARSAVRERAS